MSPVERLQQLMMWCRFPTDLLAWDHATAERCRQLLPQLATAALAVRELPPMFHTPLSRYLRGDPAIAEVIEDDDRLLLMLSDLRDYLSLMRRGYI